MFSKNATKSAIIATQIIATLQFGSTFIRNSRAYIY